MPTPITLQRYLIDRATGATSEGLTEIVLLVFTDVDNREYAYTLSKVDAMEISLQLRAAAIDAREMQLRAKGG